MRGGARRRLPLVLPESRGRSRAGNPAGSPLSLLSPVRTQLASHYGLCRAPSGGAPGLLGVPQGSRRAARRTVQGDPRLSRSRIARRSPPRRDASRAGPAFLSHRAVDADHLHALLDWNEVGGQRERSRRRKTQRDAEGSREFTAHAPAEAAENRARATSADGLGVRSSFEEAGGDRGDWRGRPRPFSTAGRPQVRWQRRGHAHRDTLSVVAITGPARACSCRATGADGVDSERTLAGGR
jgi:hypothetical protein